MPTPRPGSRKASVYEAFFQGGVDAATTLGVSLQLAVGTVKSWCGGWAKEGKAPAKSATPTGDVRVTKHKDWGADWDDNRSSRLFWDNGMGWALAPPKAQVGDRFEWANQRYVILQGTSQMILRKI